MQGFYNMRLVHKEFGEGCIKEYDGKTITVCFASGKVRFRCPNVFQHGLMKTTNDKDEAKLEEVLKRYEERYIVRSEISSNVFQLKKTETATKSNSNQPTDGNSQGRQSTQKSSKWKLKLNFGNASFAVAVTFTVLSLLGLVAYIVCMAITTGSAHNGAIPVWAVFIGLIAFAVFGFLAFCIVNFLSSSGIKGTAYTVLTVLTFLQYYLLVVFVTVILTAIAFIVSLFRGEFGGSSGGESKKVWQVNDNGFTRTLEQTGPKAYVNGKWYYEFRDDIGNYWLSEDKKYFFKK